MTDHNQEAADWTPFWRYLESPQGHEIASRVVTLIEEVKKATLDKTAEQQKLHLELTQRQGRNLLLLQGVVFGVAILAATALAYWE